MTAEVLYYRWQMRQGTAANLATVNEIPLLGEFYLATDTGLLKKGDGVTAYNSLPYYDCTFYAVATGTNTIVATFPSVPVLYTGLLVRARAAGANTGAATFNGLPLTKFGDTALAANDIAAADHELLIVYNATTPRWELLNPAAASGGSGSSVSFNVAQTAHGFSLGNLVYKNGANYAIADADDISSTADGMVSAVIDANNFTITQIGKVTGLSGLTAGEAYFLSSTAGAMTATEPTTLSQYVGYAESSTVFIVDIGEPFVGGSGMGSGGYAKGVSFPSSPATNDQFYRTDINRLCFYDGARWLTVQEFEVQWLMSGTIPPVTGTNGCVGRGGPANLTYSVFVTRACVRHESVGVAWTGAAYWQSTFQFSGGSFSITSIQSTTSGVAELAINTASPGVPVNENFLWLPTKVGTPPNLIPYISLFYRLIIT